MHPAGALFPLRKIRFHASAIRAGKVRRLPNPFCEE
jgi:hypothetical protein